MEPVMGVGLFFSLLIVYRLWQVKEAYRAANRLRTATIESIRRGVSPVVLDHGVALVSFDDTRIKHMRNWLLRYAPATPEELDQLTLKELVEWFVAYHKVDNE